MSQSTLGPSHANRVHRKRLSRLSRAISNTLPTARRSQPSLFYISILIVRSEAMTLTLNRRKTTYCSMMKEEFLKHARAFSAPYTVITQRIVLVRVLKKVELNEHQSFYSGATRNLYQTKNGPQLSLTTPSYEQASLEVQIHT